MSAPAATGEVQLGVSTLGIVIGPERLAQLAIQRRETINPAGRWGVWDRHLREWLAVDHPNERGAWLALLDIDSLHPWDLRITRADKENRPILGQNLPEPDVEAEAEPCYECQGSGSCPRCNDGECPDCGGSGKESS